MLYFPNNFLQDFLMAQQFYKLNLPELNTNNGKPVWVVRIEDAPAYYLVNDGSFTLDNLMLCAESIFCFESLREAHHQACEYYSSHNQIYPYFDEYSEAFKSETDAKLTDDIQSEPMNFS